MNKFIGCLIFLTFIIASCGEPYIPDDGVILINNENGVCHIVKDAKEIADGIFRIDPYDERFKTFVTETDYTLVVLTGLTPCEAELAIYRNGYTVETCERW